MTRSEYDHSDHDDDEKKTGAALGARRKFDEFECPACSAHNPFETFGNGDDVLCNWCGMEFKVTVTDEGTLRLRDA